MPHANQLCGVCCLLYVWPQSVRGLTSINHDSVRIVALNSHLINSMILPHQHKPSCRMYTWISRLLPVDPFRQRFRLAITIYERCYCPSSLGSTKISCFGFKLTFRIKYRSHRNLTLALFSPILNSGDLPDIQYCSFCFAGTVSSSLCSWSSCVAYFIIACRICSGADFRADLSYRYSSLCLTCDAVSYRLCGLLYLIHIPLKVPWERRGHPGLAPGDTADL
jgi:hypothetical protein